MVGQLLALLEKLMEHLRFLCHYSGKSHEAVCARYLLYFLEDVVKANFSVFTFLCVLLCQSFIPEILKVTSASQMVDLGFMKHFRKFRLLRCLKMVSNFTPIRIVVLALSRSFKVCRTIQMQFLFDKY